MKGEEGRSIPKTSWYRPVACFPRRRKKVLKLQEAGTAWRPARTPGFGWGTKLWRFLASPRGKGCRGPERGCLGRIGIYGCVNRLRIQSPTSRSCKRLKPPPRSSPGEGNFFSRRPNRGVLARHGLRIRSGAGPASRALRALGRGHESLFFSPNNNVSPDDRG